MMKRVLNIQIFTNILNMMDISVSVFHYLDVNIYHCISIIQKTNIKYEYIC